MALPPRGTPGTPGRGPSGPGPGPSRGPAAAPPAAQKPRVDWSDPARRQSLMRRGEQSNRTKDGMNYTGLVNQDRIKQAGLVRWDWSTGKKYWAIVPYLAGPQDSEVMAGRLQEGDGTYTTGAFFHRHGQNGMDKTICLAKTYGQPCPWCEYRQWLDGQDGASLGMTDDQLDDLIKSLLPSKYAAFLYYIIDWDAENKGLQVAEISGMFFEQALMRQTYSSRGGGCIPFWLPDAGLDGGRDIEFEISGQKSKQDWGRGVAFRERRNPISAHFLDKAAEVPLDEFWNVPTYEQAYESCWQGQAPPWEDGAAPATGGQYVAPADQGNHGQAEEHYDCFRTAQFGWVQDCTTNCPDRDECSRHGCIAGFEFPAGPAEDDIPFEPPAPAAVAEPASEPPAVQPAATGPPRRLPPRGGMAPGPGGNKPTLLRGGK